MEIDELCDQLLSGDLSRDEFLAALKDLRAFSKSDRFKLSVVDGAPFSMWASDENNIIRFWECKSEEIYHYNASEAIGQSFLTLFVAEAERTQAAFDAKRIIAGKSDPGEFINNIALDHNRFGKQVSLMTNCFRVYDQESGKWLQAEVALPTDLNEVIKKHSDIIHNYQTLQQHINQYTIIVEAYLEGVQRKKTCVEAITDRIMGNAKYASLPKQVKTSIENVQGELNELYEMLNTSAKMCLENIKTAKTLEECVAPEKEFDGNKTAFATRETYLFQFLEDVITELDVEVLGNDFDLIQEKREAIDECNEDSTIILELLFSELGKLFVPPGIYSFSSDDRSNIKKRAGIEDLIQELKSHQTRVIERISSTRKKAQVKTKVAEYKNRLSDIKEKLDTYTTIVKR